MTIKPELTVAGNRARAACLFLFVLIYVGVTRILVGFERKKMHLKLLVLKEKKRLPLSDELF